VAAQDEMLMRIRKALGRPASASKPSPPPFSLPELEPVMAPLSPDDLLPTFEAELTEVGGQTYRAETLVQLDEILAKILTGCEIGHGGEQSYDGIVISRNPLLTRLGLADRLHKSSRPVAVWPEVPPHGQPGAYQNTGPEPGFSEGGMPAFQERCFEAIAGITGVDFALAESGTLVLSSITEGSQLTSLAPPIHVALYQRQQVVASLEEVLGKAPVAAGEDAPSPGRSIVLITGTSRTADIEQVLVRGVHGPREVHAILIEESCLV
jgi:hypothetical protein